MAIKGSLNEASLTDVLRFWHSAENRLSQRGARRKFLVAPPSIADASYIRRSSTVRRLAIVSFGTEHCSRIRWRAGIDRCARRRP